MAICLLLMCPTAASRAAEPAFNIDIPAMNAAEALNRFAEQTGSVMLFSYDLAHDRQAKAVHGRYTPLEGMRLLLRDTGLSGGYSDKRVVIVTENGNRPAGEGGSVKKKSLLAGIFAALAGTSVADAKSDQSGAAEPAAVALSEVIVTAQRREERLQNVGISITAFTAEALKQLGVTGTEELMFSTPGLQWASFGGVPTLNVFSLRGVSQISFEDHQEPPVAMFVDNVYNSFMGAVGQQIFDVERVEVLRGPQGTLFGRNSTGGVIHVLSKRPSEQSDAYAQLTVGRFNDVHFQGAVGGPLGSEKVLGRISGTVREADGWYKNFIGRDKGGIDNVGWRAQLELAPSDEFSALLNFRGSEDDIRGVGAFTIFPAVLNADGVGAFPQSEAEYAAFCAAAFGQPVPVPGQSNCFGYVRPNNNLFEGESDLEGYFQRKTYGGTLTMTYDLGGPSLLSISDYQEVSKTNLGDEDGSSQRLLDFFTDQDSDQFSQELRIDGGQDGLIYTAGVYYLRISGDYRSSAFLPAFADLLTDQRYSLTTEALSAFGQVEYALNDRWTVIGGLRWGEDRKDFNFVGGCSGALCPILSPPGSLQAEGLRASLNDDDFEYKLQVNLRPTESLLIYGGISQGYKAGGFNAPVLANMALEDVPFDGEKLRNYEVGVKSTLWGHTRLNASVFYYDYSSVQTFSQSQAVTTILNSDGRVTGGEIELVSRLYQGLELQIGLSLLDAKVDDITLPGGRVANRKMPFAPDLNVNGLIRKEWVLNGGTLALQGDATYVAKQQYSVFNAPVTEGDSYVVTNARISFSSPDDSWALALIGKNLSNEEYTINGFDNAGLSGVLLAAPGMPRWYGAQLSFYW